MFIFVERYNAPHEDRGSPWNTPQFISSPRLPVVFCSCSIQNYRIEYPSAFLLEVAASMVEVLQGPPDVHDGRGRGRVRCISTPLENEVRHALLILIVGVSFNIIAYIVTIVVVVGVLVCLTYADPLRSPHGQQNGWNQEKLNDNTRYQGNTRSTKGLK